MYNFDKVIDRSGSDDLKHGALLPRWGRDDLLPLWVADMDFETPSFITNALKADWNTLFSATRWSRKITFLASSTGFATTTSGM